MSQPNSPQVLKTEAEVRTTMKRLTRRSFATGAAAAIAGLLGWEWLRNAAAEDGIPWPLRRVLQFNEHLAETLFSDQRLAPTFPPDAAAEPRANGGHGLGGNFDPGAWQLRIVGPRPQQLPLAAVQALPRVEMVTELKCIEGWSTIVHWAGARLADFARKYGLDGRYVSMATPDGGYYVGLDRASALHPQTLLCYEMNGRPLSLEHGAPLRLVTPVKYGIKHIKRIGSLQFTDERPKDYWAERGYDWYAGH